MNQCFRLFALMAVSPAFAADLADLEWMLGCWESADGHAAEVWVKDTDTSFLGFSATTADGAIVFYELLRVASNTEGVTYTAYPMGQAPTVFAATEIADEHVSFTNPDHDYPQKIAYGREGGGLIAVISMLDGARPQSFDKEQCD